MMGMKMALVTPYFNQPRGNTVTVERIVNGLKAEGHNVDVISIEEGVNPELPDVDLVHGFNAFQFNAYWSHQGRPSTPYVVTMTGTDLNHSLVTSATRMDVVKALKGAEVIHVFNEKAKALLLTEVPEFGPKTVLIPQGVVAFSKKTSLYKKEPGTLVCLLPAGIRKVKNVPSAITMLAPLHEQEPSIRLWIVGPVIEEEEGACVQKLVEEHKDWVKYLGQVPHEQMGELYRGADLVLNTSISEGQSSAILEAMVMGLPIVASDITGNRDVLGDRQTGFLYKNEAHFAESVRQLIRNAELRHEIGQAAKRYVESHHSVNHEIHALLKVYKGILNGKGEH